MSEPRTGWVRFTEIEGGILVHCALCGKWARKTFMAANTNYAEARRAATEYHWQHEHSEEHAAARAVYYSPAPEETPQERVLRQVFGGDAPTDRELRRRAAQDASRAAKREIERRRREEAE